MSNDKHIEWEWGYYGRCFVNGKFSHGVRMQLYDSGVQGQYFNECPDPSGKMLGTLKDCNTLQQAVDQAEKESMRIKTEGVTTYTELKQKLKEYPFHNWSGK